MMCHGSVGCAAPPRTCAPRGAHENRSPVCGSGIGMCGCAPQFRFLRVAYMKRTERKSVILIKVGKLGRTPAHVSEQPLYNGPILPVRPTTPMCAQGRTTTSGVKL